MPDFCLLDLCLVLQCLPFSIVTERSARGGARMAPSTDGSLLWSARLLTVLPAADSCFRDGNGIPLPPRCQRSRWLLIPDTTRSLLGLMQCLPSELSACWPRPVLHAGHCYPRPPTVPIRRPTCVCPSECSLHCLHVATPVSQTSACHLLNGSSPRASGCCHHSLLQVLCAAFIPG